jgi:regulator of protease activity HflC (stomatin/prohibitin superfamily)
MNPKIKLNRIREALTGSGEQAGSGSRKADTHFSGLGIFFMIISFLIGIGFALLKDNLKFNEILSSAIITAWTLLGVSFLYSLRVARPWEKAVVLRLGKFHRLSGPGVFWLVPVIDAVTIWIDQRVRVTPFSAEKTLTKDTVPVNVDAVLFWVIWDAEKAALEVEDYQQAIAWASQTALREIIGQMTLADILIGRAKMDSDLQKIIDERTTSWGITVQSVEIRDVIIWKTP